MTKNTLPVLYETPRLSVNNVDNKVAMDKGKKKKIAFIIGSASLLVVAIIGLIIGYYSGDYGSIIETNQQSATDLPFLEFYPSKETISLKNVDTSKSNKDINIIRIPKVYLNEPFLIHATYDKGTAPDGKNIVERSNPAEATERVVFRFLLSENKNKILFSRDDYLTQTKDKTIKESLLRENIYTGYLESADILEETNEYYKINANSLILNGFYTIENIIYNPRYTTSITVISNKYTSNHKKNTNILIEYQLDGKATFSIYFCLYQLPKIPMKSRISDTRVGFFGQRYLNMGKDKTNKDNLDNTYQSRTIDRVVTIINKRNLIFDKESKIVKNPIVYVIDDSIPEKFRKYFKEGVLEWNHVFEKATGMINAIKCILPNDEDYPKHFHVGDIRFNSISVMVSPRTYAMGPSVVDPRSGEILSSDITFSSTWIYAWIKEMEFKNPLMTNRNSSLDDDEEIHHSQNDTSIHTDTIKQIKKKKNNKNNKKKKEKDQVKRRLSDLLNIKKLIKDDIELFLHDHNDNEIEQLHGNTFNFQCHKAGGEHDKFFSYLVKEYAKEMYDGYVPDLIIGAAFKETVMHEVGHTLGLRHNFIGSMARTKDQLKDPHFCKKHGLSSSIMDYIPTNIWSDMTKSNVKKDHVYYSPVMGEYDYAAIKYGYSYIEDEIPTYTNKDLISLAEKTPLFATDEDKIIGQNPYAATFDLSNNPLDYIFEIIKIIKKLRKTSMDRVILNDEWTELWKNEKRFLRYVNISIHDVSNYIGGINITHINYKKNKNNNKIIHNYVDKITTLKALTFLTDIISEPIEKETDKSKFDSIFPDKSTYGNYIENDGYCELSYSSYCNAVKLVDVEYEIERIKIEAIRNIFDINNLVNLIIVNNNNKYNNNDNNDEVVTIIDVLSKGCVAALKSNSYNVIIQMIKSLSSISMYSDARISNIAEMILSKLASMNDQPEEKTSKNESNKNIQLFAKRLAEKTLKDL